MSLPKNNPKQAEKKRSMSKLKEAGKDEKGDNEPRPSPPTSPTESEADMSESAASEQRSAAVGSKVKDKVQRPKVGDVVNGKYNVTKELGEGGFGVVLEVVSERTKEHYAMKVELEKPPEDEPGLELEGAVLRRLQGYGHVLRFIEDGKCGEHTFLVMQLAGHNLNDLRKHCPQSRFTNSTTVRVGMQCLDAIETVHVAGFLHRDIKPANFAMGFHDKDRRTVYVLDFGLVRRFRTKEGKVRPQRPTAGFRGSYQYASINAHRNVDLGRCDDVWSWLYSVIHMRVGKLPWRKINGKKKVGDFKAQVKKEELLNEMEPEFYKIYDNLTTLKYEDEPPYVIYRDQLTKVIQRKNYLMDAPFDWEEGGEHYKHTIYMKPQPYAQPGKNASKLNVSKVTNKK